MRSAILAISTALALAAANVVDANNRNLDRLNEQLAGRVEDFTRNHGVDRRLFSNVLDKYRDLYVYLPPGYRADQPCNLIVWLHGAFGDEQIAFFLARIEVIDRLMLCGACGPTIVVFPDCTVSGLSSPLAAHSFMINGRSGCFEDHLLQEIVPFVERRYHIKPEREARALAGISAGGFGALSIGIRHRERFATVSALGPPANLRYDNIEHRYFEDFNPATFRWREDYRSSQVVGRFFAGLVRLRVGPFVNPIFGPRSELIDNVKKLNPADLLFTENVHPGELNLYVQYPKDDNFNFDAQSESFIHFARMRGLGITVVRDEQGRHTVAYFQDAMPTMWRWLARRLPGGCQRPEAFMEGELPTP